MPSGSRTRLTSAWWIATSSANDPSSVNPGWRCRSHTCCSPARHAAQDPHAHTNGTVTSSPTRPRADQRTDLDDDARQLVAGHVRERDVVVVTLPAVPVATGTRRSR